MGGPPTGTVTFLFTDIEGSTRLRQERPEAFAAALAQHHALLRQAITANGGHVFKIIGDAFCAAFATARAGVQAALAAQKALQAAEWGEAPLRVRMGLHTGAAELVDGEYEGFTLARVQRLMSAGHGGQVLVSQSTANLAVDSLPPEVSLRDLGERRLKDIVLPEHVYQLSAPGLRSNFPPLKTLEAAPHNLPAQVTSFVGREVELAEATRLLAQTRLLTLVGPGGTGKTRLSLQVAAAVLAQYPHGAWLVELAPLTDPDLVPQAVASALGLRESSDRPVLQTLGDYLAGKTLLLILDNCEHLLEACGWLAHHLLQATPGVRLLASSREALGVAGEAAFPVPALTLPDVGPEPGPAAADLARYEAVRLFVDRARAVQPSFALTDANAPAVARICARLDGIPLAIELAAARVRALAPEQIVARLDDRFRLLTGGSRTALQRHQTLAALIDWSYDLLAEPERRLLGCLAVFAGGWTLEAAERVCAGDGIEPVDVLDLLTRLVDKSLVLAEERNGAVRYRMLETIQQYTREKTRGSPDDARARAQHLAFYLELAEAAEPKLRTAEQREWLDRLESDHNNLRAALRRAQASGDGEPALRLGGALFWFWLLRGYGDEGRRWLEGALAQPGPAGQTRARALRAAGYLAVGQGQIEAGRVQLQDSLAMFAALGDRVGIADALQGLGRAAYFQGEYSAARTLLEASLAESQTAGYGWGSAQAQHRLGMLALNQGDLAGAHACFEASVEHFRALGDVWGLAYTLNALGEEALRRGDFARAEAVLSESLGIFDQLGSKSGTAVALGELGWLALYQGDFPAARSQLEQSLALRREMGHRVGVGIALNLLGEVALHLGEYAEARALIDQGLALRQAAASKSGMGWSLQNLGYLALKQGDAGEAIRHFRECLRLFVELGIPVGVAECLEGLACAAAAGLGDTAAAQRVLRLAAAAEAIRARASAPLPPYRRADYDRAVASARGFLDEAAAAGAWAQGQEMGWQQAAAYALGNEPPG